MPIISTFYGVVIMMFFFDKRKHKKPHIHVRYQEQEAVFSIPDGNLLEGKIRANKRKLVEAWIEIHQEDLMTDWQLAVEGQQVFTIDPLK